MLDPQDGPLTSSRKTAYTGRLIMGLHVLWLKFRPDFYHCQRAFSGHFLIGIVQKVFSEKASAIARMRQKCVRNASKMRQKCVKMGLVLLGKEERPKCVRNPSKLRQKCVKNARNTFGGEHLLGMSGLSKILPLATRISFPQARYPVYIGVLEFQELPARAPPS